MTSSPPDTVQVECFCRGQNPGCVKCGGMGTVSMPACRRCRGKGTQGGAKCLDCRGEGWRPLDVPGWDDTELR